MMGISALGKSIIEPRHLRDETFEPLCIRLLTQDDGVHYTQSDHAAGSKRRETNRHARSLS